jgi:hypothetical protein
MRKILLFITLSTPMLLLAAPNNPTDLQLSALSTHNVSIRWKDISSDESGFKIYRDGKLVTITPPNTEIYYDDNLKANTTYRYTVKATDDIPDIKDNELDISMEKLPHGTKLSSIKNGKKELLNDTNSELFSLTIQNIKTKEIKTVVPSHGWNSVKFGLFDKHIRTITLSQPTDDTLPSTLRVLILIDQFKGASAWDLKVTGVGKNHSLLDATFPNITIKATNNSHFFLPLLFGQVLDNPQTNVDKVLTYPKGSDYSLSGASMQFLSYYDKDNQGIYFGFHDPKASLKKFHISSKNSGVNLQGSTPIPDKTLAENDWDFSGIFELDLYDGDWYEASQIYKHWVFNYSNYKIVDSLKRLARAKEIGKISLWSAGRLWQKNKNLGNDLVEDEFTDFKNFLKDDQTDVTLGVHFTAWSGEDFDKNIPDVFLNAKENLSGLVSNLKQKFGDKMMIDLYTNAYIYDTNLPSYPAHEPAAAKGEDGKIPYQYWGVDDDDPNKHRKFAIMCPTQKIWQDKNVAVHRFIETLGIDGVYLDQVTAASPIACTDKNHGHSIGGGDFWRSGYAKMIDSIYKVHQDKTYLFSETVTDSLIDSFDGFMTMYHTLQNQVPALQSIYGGKVQFFGPAIGTDNYVEDANKPDSENLYALAAQGFAFGEILGPIYPSISQHYVDGAANRARKDRAATYIKKLAFMREKLKRFISFGSMQKPLTLTGNIPTITVPATKHGAIKLLAIQNGIWKKDSSIVVVFINGNKPDLNAADINFNFAFDGSKYGLHNGFSIQEITPTSQRDLGVVENSFTKNVTLKSADMKAYILREN